MPRGPRQWGAYLAALTGTLLGLMVYGFTHPGSALDGATRLAFRPLCHQLPERSFMLGDAAMCVCHRCFGIYLGLFVGGLLALAGVSTDPGRRDLWLLATVPMLVHVVLLNLWQPADLWHIRLATGLLFGAWGGLAVSIALGRAFAQQHDVLPPRAALDLREERT